MRYQLFFDDRDLDGDPGTDQLGQVLPGRVHSITMAPADVETAVASIARAKSFARAKSALFAQVAAAVLVRRLDDLAGGAVQGKAVQCQQRLAVAQLAENARQANNNLGFNYDALEQKANEAALAAALGGS